MFAFKPGKTQAACKHQTRTEYWCWVKVIFLTVQSSRPRVCSCCKLGLFQKYTQTCNNTTKTNKPQHFHFCDLPLCLCILGWVWWLQSPLSVTHHYSVISFCNRCHCHLLKLLEVIYLNHLSWLWSDIKPRSTLYSSPRCSICLLHILCYSFLCLTPELCFTTSKWLWSPHHTNIFCYSGPFSKREVYKHCCYRKRFFLCWLSQSSNIHHCIFTPTSCCGCLILIASKNRAFFYHLKIFMPEYLKKILH